MTRSIGDIIGIKSGIISEPCKFKKKYLNLNYNKRINLLLLLQMEYGNF